MRFSISWPRVLPDGTGDVNRAGLDFYSRVVDECLEAGIEPWVTLYHWDLPLALQRRGGWTNREIVGWFESYASLMADTLGDRVRHWMVCNEPLSFTVLGQLLGAHPPRRFGLRSYLSSLHHVNLVHAVAGSCAAGGAPRRPGRHHPLPVSRAADRQLAHERRGRAKRRRVRQPRVPRTEPGDWDTRSTTAGSCAGSSASSGPATTSSSRSTGTSSACSTTRG